MSGPSEPPPTVTPASSQLLNGCARPTASAPKRRMSPGPNDHCSWACVATMTPSERARAMFSADGHR